jgi:hypothetical protein
MTFLRGFSSVTSALVPQFPLDRLIVADRKIYPALVPIKCHNCTYLSNGKITNSSHKSWKDQTFEAPSEVCLPHRRGHPSKKRLGDALERLSPGDSQQQKPLEVL